MHGKNQRSKDRQLADLMKKLFQIVWKLNVDLKLHYVPSAENLADAPSRNDILLNIRPHKQRV